MFRKIFMFLFCLMIGATMAFGAEGDMDWIRQFTGSIPATDYGRSVAYDSSGVYVVGYSNGFLPGQTSAGREDVFIRKYDYAGNELWTRQFGTSSIDNGFGVAVNSSGVYVVGYTEGTLPGQTSAGGTDAFIRKYDSAGNELWTQQFGTGSYDRGYGVAVGSSGVYVAGYTPGNLPGQPITWSTDAFLTKFIVNHPPVADAGLDQTVNDTCPLGTETVKLDGSGSSDLDNNISSYIWKEGVNTLATEVAAEVSLGVGVHAISLEVTDAYGLTSTDTVIITVNPAKPDAMLIALILDVNKLNIKQGILNSLDAKLNNALASLTDIKNGKRQDATNKLQAFINECKAQKDKAIKALDTTAPDGTVIKGANSLIAAARCIIAALGQ